MNFLYNLVDIFLMNNNEKTIYKIIKNEPQKVIFDVGSFKGRFTKKILKIDQNKETKYFLFDPNPKSRLYLDELINKNPNISFDCVGLSNQTEKKIFHLNSFFEASGSSFQTISKDDKLWNISRKLISTFNIFDLNSKNNFKSFEVKTNTIDKFCSTNQIDKIDLLKIDAEGHEEYILEGASKMFENNKVKLIYVEILSTKQLFKQKKDKILNHLEKENFKFIKEYPIHSVSILSNLKAADFLLINNNYRSDNK